MAERTTITEKDVTDKSVGPVTERPYYEAISPEHKAFLKENFPGQLPPTPKAEAKAAEQEPTRVEDEAK